MYIYRVYIYMYMLSMKYFGNKVQIRKKTWKECV